MPATSYTNTVDINSLKDPIKLIAFYEKWVEALKSGEYIQQKGVLNAYSPRFKKPHMCCLGVAVDMCGADWHTADGTGEILTHEDGSEVYGYSRGHDYTFPNREDSAALNLNVILPDGIALGERLAEINDYSSSYAKVIKHIESTIKDLKDRNRLHSVDTVTINLD